MAEIKDPGTHLAIAILYAVILTFAILGGYLVAAGAAGTLVIVKLVKVAALLVEKSLKKEVA